MVTGLDADGARFRERWAEFLRAVGEAVKRSRGSGKVLLGEVTPRWLSRDPACGLVVGEHLRARPFAYHFTAGPFAYHSTPHPVVRVPLRAQVVRARLHAGVARVSLLDAEEERVRRSWRSKDHGVADIGL
ncbi:hypothetical protein [Streptomyces sp. R41]|uniref:Uncharacterized protein n=1 Tax=Streptomyces sp. R41 TaxID=3238632 RepID=A0AB39RR36_9ACTN